MRTPAFLSRLGMHERTLLLMALLVAGGAWAFVEIADEVQEHETREIDESVLRFVRTEIDGPVLRSIARDLTALGGYPVLGLATLFVCGLLALERRFALLIVVLVSSVGGGLWSSLLKGLFARPRPDVVPHLVDVSSPSFPSGHAMASAAIYVTLGALLSRTSERRSVKIYYVAAALLATFVVGVTRVYLGVHYPSDVLAGWTAGLAWAVLCWVIAVALQRRGRVEPPAPDRGGP